MKQVLKEILSKYTEGQILKLRGFNRKKFFDATDHLKTIAAKSGIKEITLVYFRTEKEPKYGKIEIKQACKGDIILTPNEELIRSPINYLRSHYPKYKGEIIELRNFDDASAQDLLSKLARFPRRIRIKSLAQTYVDCEKTKKTLIARAHSEAHWAY
ncbi:hypothetical protein, partial [Escherichia coli]|uniref:hypothetical protein n=1 Tax=Escherichia coli TaxID=562 RepID=UPI00291692BD